MSLTIPPTPRHLAIVTTSRADYDLIKPLWQTLQTLQNQHHIDTTLVATGSHFIPAQGMTIRRIEADGVAPLLALDYGIQQDTAHNICHGLATGLRRFSDFLQHNHVDALVLLGDRFELLPLSQAALIHHVPIAHIHGGETTTGAIDNAIRHSVSHMAHWHFVSHPQYKQVLQNMGLAVQHIWHVGAIGLDNLQADHWPKSQLLTTTGLNDQHPIALVTFHPETHIHFHGKGVVAHAQQQIKALIRAMAQAVAQHQLQFIITHTNADEGGTVIQKALEAFKTTHPQQVFLTGTLGMSGYLSAMTHCQLMLGNSSSGILEASSFALPVVNIGERQSGRIQPGNVIQTNADTHAITQAISLALSDTFKQKITGMINPYRSPHGATAPHIAQILLEQLA